jgi:hypothetical protein
VQRLHMVAKSFDHNGSNLGHCPVARGASSAASPSGAGLSLHS